MKAYLSGSRVKFVYKETVYECYNSGSLQTVYKKSGCVPDYKNNKVEGREL